MKRPSRQVGFALRFGLVSLLFLAAGCGGNGNDAPTNSPTPTGTPTSSITPTSTITPTPSHTRTLTAMPTFTATQTRTSTPMPTNTRTTMPTLTSTPAPTTLPGVEMAGRLELDIRWSADVTIRVTDLDLTAKLTLNDGREVATVGVALEGVGKVHQLPEAGAVLYAARFSSAPVAGTRCGSQPISLALTLLRRGENNRVAGGVAVYCGADTYSGIPARILRLSGLLTAK